MVRRFIFWAAGIGLLGPIGCERQDEASRPTPPPRVVVQRLMEARRTGQYRDFERLVTRDRCHDLINTLLAVDEFLNANRALCNYVRERFTADLSQTIDQSHWGTNLGLFSRHVELVSERIEGERAIVSFSVDNRIPLQHASLMIEEGQWRYDPGEGFDSRIPAGFLRMAEGLRQALAELTSGRLSADTVGADPARLIEEVRLRLKPGAALLPRPEPGQPEDG